MKTSNFLVAFSVAQLVLVLCIPFLVGYQDQIHTLPVESVAEQESTDALQVLLKNERHYQVAVKKLYRALVFEAVILAMLCFYFRGKLRSTEGK